MDKVEIRAVIKYFCKKGMSLEKIHNDFIKTLVDESPSYSMVKKWATEFRRGREINKRSGHPEEATKYKNVELVHSLIMCDMRRSLHGIQSNLNGSNIFGTMEICSRYG